MFKIFNVDEPHYIWAFVNPQRADVVKKKTIRDVIKAWVDNHSHGRKKLLDAVEEIIRNNEKESSEALKSKNLEVFKTLYIDLRLTFNYPGTKRALISYAQNLSKIDGRVSLSKEFSSCVDKAANNHENFKRAVFYDPIQGVEKPVSQQIEDMEVPLRLNNYFPMQETPHTLNYGPTPMSQSKFHILI